MDAMDCMIDVRRNHPTRWQTTDHGGKQGMAAAMIIKKC